jgi:Transposase
MHRRRVLGDRITYVGLDVHKEGIVVAVAEGGLRGEVRDYGRIANTPAALRRLAGKLGREGAALRFCYEAGPCGYGIQRQLSADGHECVVVAPSLIPKRAGDRVKTDRRDATSLARLHRAGELTAVWVPDPGHEAMRDPGFAGAGSGEGQPRAIREIAWKAQLRLCARYRKLARGGKPANVVTAAVARELAGFIWAIARRVPPAAG